MRSNVLAVFDFWRRVCGGVGRLLAGLPRCHWLTWSLTLLVALALVLIVVPGDWISPLPSDSPTRWERRCQDLYAATREQHKPAEGNLAQGLNFAVYAFQHGWPRPFLARALVLKLTADGGQYRVRSTHLIRYLSPFRSWGGSLYLGVSWSNYDNWPFSADDWIWDPWALAIDVAAALLIVGLVAGATERWIRTRGGILRYRLLDLFAVIAVVAVVTAVCTYHARLRRVEAQGGAPQLTPAFVAHDGDLTLGQRYTGPAWLRKLAGTEYLLPLFHHVYDVSIGLSDRWRDLYAQLPTLPYLESVRVRDGLPLAALEQLECCGQLTELELPALDPSAVAVPSTSLPLFGVQDLPRLERLHLTRIGLQGESIQASHLEQVASFPTVKTISLFRVSTTAEETEAIRARHPRVKIIVQSDFGVGFF